MNQLFTFRLTCQQTTATVTACFSPLFFHPSASSSCGWTQRIRLILHFVGTGPRVCRTHSCVHSLKDWSCSWWQEARRAGSNNYFILKLIFRLLLFPLLLQIIVKRQLRRQEFPQLAHSSDGFQVEHFKERDWRSWCVTGGRSTVGGEE